MVQGTDARLVAGLLTLIVALALLPAAQAQLQVITVPKDPLDTGTGIPHPTYNGQSTIFKAIARDCSSSCVFRWDFDDDGTFDTAPTPVRSVVGDTCYDLGESFLYQPQVQDRRFDAVIEVSCPNQLPVQATYPVYINADIPTQPDPFDPGSQPVLPVGDPAAREQLDWMANKAIDDALWRLHLSMTDRSGSLASITGFWSGVTGDETPATASALWAFTLNGHVPAYPPATYQSPPPAGSNAANDDRWNNDPYAETAARALNYLTLQSRAVPVDLPFEADDATVPLPGTNNGQGLAFGPVQDDIFATGHVMGALVALAESAGPDGKLQTGAASSGSIVQVVQEMVDYIASAQILSTATDDYGGFSYTRGQTTHDGSTAQWAYIGLEAADVGGGPFGVHVPDSVKPPIWSILLRNQDPTTGLARPTNTTCTGTGNFYLTGGALVATGWLGMNRFSPSDPTVGSTDWQGNPITRGQMRNVHDGYVQGLGSFWESGQIDCTSLVSGHWSNIGGNGFARNDDSYAIYAAYSTQKGLRTQNPELPLVAGLDWAYEYETLLTRRNRVTVDWPEASWGGTHLGLARYGRPWSASYAVLILTPTLFEPNPVPASDSDGDGFTPNGMLPDCDDNDATVFPGAEQICGDGKNNDCFHVSWPLLDGTNEADDDGDGLSECDGDCDDARSALSRLPNAPGNLQVAHNKAADATTFEWDIDSGNGVDVELVHELVRRGDPTPLSATWDDPICRYLVEPAGSSTATLVVEDTLQPGEVAFYLPRSRNLCGVTGGGNVSDGTARTIAHCTPGPPIVSFVTSPNPSACGEAVTFDAGLSRAAEPGLDLGTFLWDFGDGVGVATSTSTLLHTYDRFGDFEVRLTVSDNFAPPVTASSTLLHTVNQGNNPPVADAGGPYQFDLGAPVQLDGSRSSDPDTACGDRIVNWQWDLGVSAPTSTIAFLDLSPSEAANIFAGPADPVSGEPSNLVRLTVVDSFGVGSTASSTLLRIYDNRPLPSLVFSPDPPLCGDTIEFDASGSTHGSPDRTIVEYEWDFENDGIVDQLGPSPLASHVYTVPVPEPAPLERTLELRVIDDVGNSESLFVPVTFQPPPTPPTADANGPYVVEVGTVIQLDAGASFDLDEPSFCDAIVTFQWDINFDGDYDDPIDVTTDEPLVVTAADPTWFAGQIATVRLRVTDTAGLSAEDDATVQVILNEPQADFDATPPSGTCNAPVTFDASSSSHDNPLRSIVRFDWDFGDGDTADDAGPVVQHPFLSFGTVDVELTVTDDNLPPRTDSLVVPVTVDPLPPTAVVPPDLLGTVGDPLTLDASGSSDPDAACGDTLTFSWDLNDDGVADFVTGNPTDVVPWSTISALNPPLQFPTDPATKQPTNPVTLRLTDSFGGIEVASSTLSIYQDAPEANVESGADVAGCNQPVVFRADTSRHLNPQQEIVQFDWDFDFDGTFEVADGGPIQIRAFSTFDTRSISVRAVDDGGKTASSTISLFVNAGNRPPDPRLSAPRFVSPGEPLQLDATGSSDPDASCGDSVAEFRWDFDGDGTFEQNTGGTPIAADIAPPTLTDLRPRVEVEDSFGETSRLDVVVRVVDDLVLPRFGPSPNVPLSVAAVVEFDGSLSIHTRPDRSLVRFDWDFGDGTILDDAGPFVAHQYLGLGTFTVTLTVHDDRGQTQATSEDFDVQLQQPAPQASAGGPYEISAGEDLTVDAGASTSPNGPIVQFEWDLTDDGTFDFLSPNPIAVIPGPVLGGAGVLAPADPELRLPDNVVRLRVTDAAGQASEARTILRVYDPFPLPEIRVADRLQPLGLPIEFDAGTRHGNPDRQVIEFEWDFGDTTPTVTLPNPTVDHTFVEGGTFSVQVQATDDAIPPQVGLSNRLIDVGSGNRPPTADAGPSLVVRIGDGVTLNGSGSFDDDASSFTDSIVEFEWDIGDDGIPDVTTPQPSVFVDWPTLDSLLSPEPCNRFPVRLRVVDSFGASSSMRTVIEFEAP